MIFLNGRNPQKKFSLLSCFIVSLQPLLTIGAHASLHLNGYSTVEGTQSNEFLIKVKNKRVLDELRREFNLEVIQQPILKTSEGVWFKVSDQNFNVGLLDIQAHVYSNNFLQENILHIEENHRWRALNSAVNPQPESPPRLPSRQRVDPLLERTYGIHKIQAPKAWLKTIGSDKIVIADIDTGIDYNHKDLINNIWRNPREVRNDGQDNDGNGYTDDVVGWDFANNDPLPFDDNGHGSHTSGSIAATGGNGIGTSGVAQRAQIMGLKFLDADGSGTTENAIRAINYAVENGAVILSNSWGGDEYSKALEDAIAEAGIHNVLFVAAAGNDGTNNDTQPMYPAAYNLPNVIAVAASDKDDLLTDYSNFGVNSVHIAAPGDAVWSTVPDNKYEVNSGTSMACPHVAGAAALLKSFRPQLSALQIKKILMDSVDKLPDYADKIASGGRLNVARALELAAGQ
jgi:subtilisin family serine protease